MKSGYQTTEFWLTAVPVVVGVLIMAGILDPAATDEFSRQIEVAVSAIVTITGVVSYIAGRTWLKAKTN